MSSSLLLSPATNAATLRFKDDITTDVTPLRYAALNGHTNETRAGDDSADRTTPCSASSSSDSSQDEHHMDAWRTTATLLPSLSTSPSCSRSATATAGAIPTTYSPVALKRFMTRETVSRHELEGEEALARGGLAAMARAAWHQRRRAAQLHLLEESERAAVGRESAVAWMVVVASWRADCAAMEAAAAMRALRLQELAIAIEDLQRAEGEQRQQLVEEEQNAYPQVMQRGRVERIVAQETIDRDQLSRRALTFFAVMALPEQEANARARAVEEAAEAHTLLLFDLLQGEEMTCRAHTQANEAQEHNRTFPLLFIPLLEAAAREEVMATEGVSRTTLCHCAVKALSVTRQYLQLHREVATTRAQLESNYATRIVSLRAHWLDLQEQHARSQHLNEESVCRSGVAQDASQERQRLPARCALQHAEGEARRILLRHEEHAYWSLYVRRSRRVSLHSRAEAIGTEERRRRIAIALDEYVTLAALVGEVETNMGHVLRVESLLATERADRAMVCAEEMQIRTGLQNAACLELEEGQRRAFYACEEGESRWHLVQHACGGRCVLEEETLRRVVYAEAERQRVRDAQMAWHSAERHHRSRLAEEEFAALDTAVNGWVAAHRLLEAEGAARRNMEARTVESSWSILGVVHVALLERARREALVMEEFTALLDAACRLEHLQLLQQPEAAQRDAILRDEQHARLHLYRVDRLLQEEYHTREAVLTDEFTSLLSAAVVVERAALCVAEKHSRKAIWRARKEKRRHLTVVALGLAERAARERLTLQEHRELEQIATRLDAAA